jgi:hypothetical protein
MQRMEQRTKENGKEGNSKKMYEVCEEGRNRRGEK